MRRICVVLLLLLLFLSGCRSEQGIEIVSGELLSPEQQQSMYDEQQSLKPDPNIGGKATVYWTPSGSKYHKDPDCSYLKNAKELYSGTIAQAVNHCADAPCSRCAGG